MFQRREISFRDWETKNRVGHRTQSLLFTLLSSSTEKAKAWCWLIIFNYLIISIASPTHHDLIFALPHMCFMMCNLPVSVSVIYKLSICSDAAGVYAGVGRRRRRLCCLPTPPSCSLWFPCETAPLPTCAHLTGDTWKLISWCLRTALRSLDESEYKISECVVVVLWFHEKTLAKFCTGYLV